MSVISRGGLVVRRHAHHGEKDAATTRLCFPGLHPRTSAPENKVFIKPEDGGAQFSGVPGESTMSLGGADVGVAGVEE